MEVTTRDRWVARWDAQQEYYVADREERFRVVADVVRWSCERRSVTNPKIVDLGCGPGSLAARLSALVPGSQITGIDSDPLLLALTGDDGSAGYRTVLGDVTATDWTVRVEATGPVSPWDAVVSSTALHWLVREQLADLYKIIAAQLVPGGVFLDLDHREPRDATAREICQEVSAQKAHRDGKTRNETWGAWWDAVKADPELGALIDDRSDAAVSHHDENGLLSVQEQCEMLLAAGFRTAEPVWQSGTDYVLAAVR